MLIRSCVCCGDPIVPENDSREHIIPNAIGGRRKVSGFICGVCNSSTGHSWDAELAKQLNSLCLFFGVLRERGASPGEVVETTVGERYVMQPGGGFALEKPHYSEAAIDGGVALRITARSTSEARAMLRGVKRKFPNVDVEALLAKALPERSYPKGMVHLTPSIGGPLSSRSIVKTAIAIACDAGLPLSACDTALGYLRGGDVEPPYGFFYDNDLVSNRPPEVPLHCAAVFGNPTTGLLLGYVEYFGVFRMVVCLSTSYTGANLAYSYGIDPTNGEALPLSVRMPFGFSDIQDIYDYKRAPAASKEAAFSALVPLAMRRQAERELNRVLEEAFKYAGEACGLKVGDIISPEIAPRFGQLMTEHMMPYLMHRTGAQWPSDGEQLVRNATTSASGPDRNTRTGEGKE